MEGFTLETISVAGLPTNLGTFSSPPAGLLCSGRQDKIVVASLYLLLLMARQRLAERTQLSLPTALGAVSRENRLGCLPRQGLAKRKARKGAQRQDDTHAPE